MKLEIYSRCSPFLDIVRLWQFKSCRLRRRCFTTHGSRLWNKLRFLMNKDDGRGGGAPFMVITLARGLGLSDSQSSFCMASLTCPYLNAGLRVCWKAGAPPM